MRATAQIKSWGIEIKLCLPLIHLTEGKDRRDMDKSGSEIKVFSEEVCKGWPEVEKAHTYASENADIYRAYDAGQEAMLKRCRLAALRDREQLLEKIERPLLLAIDRADILLKSSTVPNTTEKFLIGDLNKIRQLIKGEQ